MLDKLKELKAELDKVKSENSELKAEVEAKVAELEKSIEEASKERKTKVEVKADEKVVEKAVATAKDEYLKSFILGQPLSSDKFKDAAGIIEKALTPSDVTDWVAEAFSKDILEQVELDLVVANSFSKIAVPKNYGSLSIPTKTANLKAYLIQPSASAIESAIAGGKINFKPQKVKTLAILTDEVNEETVTSVLELTKAELSSSLARALEEIVIMGDTTTSDANDVKKVADGLLKTGKGHSVDAGGDDLALADIVNARLALGVLGVNPKDLMLVVRPETYVKFLSNTTEVLTVDKMGPNATIRNGVLGSIYGIEIVVSEYIPYNLDANGNVASDGTKTAALLVNKGAFMRADRPDMVLSENDRDITKDVNLLTARTFFDFKGVTVNSQVGVSAIINLA